MKEARVLAMKLPRTLPTHEVTGVVKNNTYQINLLVLLETCCIEEWDRPPTFPPTPRKLGKKKNKQRNIGENVKIHVHYQERCGWVGA